MAYPTADDIVNCRVANAVLDVARSTDARYDGPSGPRAYLCAVFDALLPKLAPLGRGWLTRKLVELNRLGMIELSRADLVINPELEAASEIEWAGPLGLGRATFHFVRVPA